jgi:4-carboxymuconolactone decarboxylase
MTMPPLSERLPPLAREAMTEAQRSAADELIAGPRKGVKGPFIALLRSPELMARLQKVGEYLRFDSALSPRASEFAMLIVARAWTQQFEWFTHVPLALKAGTAQDSVDALREGRRPAAMSDEEAEVYGFSTELLDHRGVSDATYREAVDRFGERGVIDLVSILGYFTLVSMVLNVAHIPEEPGTSVERLPPMPR